MGQPAARGCAVSMDDRLQALLADVGRAESLAGQELARALRRAAWLSEADIPAIAEFLAAAADLPQPLSSPADRLLAASLGILARAKHAALALDANLALEVERLYGRLDRSSAARASLLAWLAAAGSRGEIEM